MEVQNSEDESVSSVSFVSSTLSVPNSRQSPQLQFPSTFTPKTTSTALPKKIMGRNHNNTLFPTSYPGNLAELQLYRVMQRASLLFYYDNLVEMGGDDVEQLCEAGEQEFLEIMSLVGMATKPLHVRRLQKSLQDWFKDPAKFRSPLVRGEDYELDFNNSDSSKNISSTSNAETACPLNETGSSLTTSPSSLQTALQISNVTKPIKRVYSEISASCSSYSRKFENNLTNPVLKDYEINKISMAAEKLSKNLPNLEPKIPNNKKKMCKQLEQVISMPDTNPQKMDEIRKYSAIYGRFDCKRKPEKPLTLHEVSVNEAAAQLCRFIPALLTRRDKLFPLARQVVKDSGCYINRIHTSDYINTESTEEQLPKRKITDEPPSKYIKNSYTSKEAVHLVSPREKSSQMTYVHSLED